MAIGAVISAIHPGSKAERAGLAPGDRILKINGESLRDLIDLSFALSEKKVELEVDKGCGKTEKVLIKKTLDESLGFEFESAVFDRVRTCANKCLFCFVDQMPEGLRETLYVKDDDYRLSFLYGNFVTLTNLTEADVDRIRRYHLSPLYVSVHTTDGDLRKKMLGTPRAADIVPQLRRFAETGIEMHTQVVLCPEYNDGAALTRTITDLAELRPEVLSLAIVPVGLTRFRSKCALLRAFSSAEAAAIVDEVSGWQQKFRSETGNSFVYLSDEFYLKAGRGVPPEEWYDGYPQLENGIGLVRSFVTEWEESGDISSAIKAEDATDAGETIVVCGTAFAPILADLLAPLSPGVRVEPVVNRFFGPGVNVSGLLTGGDIADHILALGRKAQRLILPVTTLRKQETVFLDGLTVAGLQELVEAPVQVVEGAAGLMECLRMRGEPG